MYRILFSRRAHKSFMRLAQEDARRIQKVLDTLAQNPRTPGTIRLKNAPVADYRYRVGDYRLLFEIDDEKHLLLLYDNARRGERTYKRQ
ncbi:MAG: type II toxin-antitoxin system RelE/ParE family toxin [Chloroflexi bacterium]|nr:type II toxin-antitoxin system RelE/ParE family toxin [Chloroflexota bacterium]